MDLFLYIQNELNKS